MRALLFFAVLVGCGRPDGMDDFAGLPAAAVTDPTPARETATEAPVSLEAPKPPLGGLREVKGFRTTLYAVNERGQLERYNTRCGKPTLESTGPVITRLLDVDDQGNAFVFPEGTRDSKVVRIDPQGNQTDVVEAGRGIWEFAISPEGDTMYVTACGPTGIFAYPPTQPLQKALEPPETLWSSHPSVLGAGRTLFSLSYGAKNLVRTTAAGSSLLGDAANARLVRCGAHVCGVRSNEVLEWDASGTLLRTIPAPEGSTVVTATANWNGLFLLVAGAEGRHLVQVE